MDRRFCIWVGAATLSAVGDGVLYFAVAWTATGISAQFAGLLFTLILLPRTLLMLVGGAAADRWGIRHTLVGCNAVMVLVLVAFLAARGLGLPLIASLIVLILGTAVVDAFALPAGGVVPRLFVPAESLGRAMSVTGGLLQVARLIGPPLGGIVLVVVDLSGAVVVNLVSFLLILVVLVAVRPRYEPAADLQTTSLARRVVDGLRAARQVPGVVTLLAAVALVAGTLIPILSLCVPLAARERGWSAGQTGLVETCWIVGTLGVSLVIARRGTSRRPIMPLAGGPLLAATGVLVIACTPVLAVSLAGAWVMGLGTALFTGHVFPAYVLKAPEGMLARFQALLGVVQAGPMLLSNNVLAAVAASAGVTTAFGLAAGCCTLAGLITFVGRAGLAMPDNTPAHLRR